MNKNTDKMPVIFIGHGSPMNVIEDNNFKKEWITLAQELPKPEAILCISAHWYTPGESIVNTASKMELIYDFYGFPNELYEVQYPVDGAPDLARQVKELLGSQVTEDPARGLDHGAWCVLEAMYPNHDIPVCQLSVDGRLTPDQAVALGKKLSSLREQGILILGSGDIVHNLSATDFSMIDKGYSWAEEFDHYISENITAKNWQAVVDYQIIPNARKAFMYNDHYYPFLYVLGAADKSENITVFNQRTVLGAISMTCYVFGL